MLEALPLSGLVGGGARGAASADLARVLVLLRGVVATESATSEEAFASAALGSGAGARQGGTTGDFGAATGVSEAFGSEAFGSTPLWTWVTLTVVLCLLGGGAVGALGTLSTISASTGLERMQQPQ